LDDKTSDIALTSNGLELRRLPATDQRRKLEAGVPIFNKVIGTLDIYP
jgi:hypothetical protein